MKAMTAILAGLILLAVTGRAPVTARAQESGPARGEPIQQEEPASPARPSQPAVAAAGPVSLGEFAVKVASGLELPAPAGGHTPESAAWALLQKGVRLRADLASLLNEADAVTILNGLGFKIRTTTPSRVMSRDRAEILIETFITSSE